MAGFKTHLAVSALTGIGYGAAAYGVYDVPASACILAGGLCSVSGMLPDIDSGPGRPLRESLSFAAAVVSTMLVDRFRQFNLPMDMIILASAAVYLAVRFGVAEFLRRYTVHRGMFHSLPAAAIFGELAYLLMTGDVPVRAYKAGAVVAGYLSHLILDEMYSVEYRRGRMAFKRSCGSALKLFGRDLLPNVSAYAKLGLLTFLVLNEPAWMQKGYQDRVEQTADAWLEMVLEYSQPMLAETTPASSDEVLGMSEEAPGTSVSPPPWQASDAPRPPSTPRTGYAPDAWTR